MGFGIGPRINAAGRRASAETAIDLFAAETDEIAWKVCAELDRMNAERQAVELEVRTAAEQQIEPSECGGLPPPSKRWQASALRRRVLILAGENWHKGVIGLAAGRIAQKYHRPTLVISIDGETAVGSARSIPTIDLHAQLESVSDVFTHFGGHEFACGFSLPAARFPELRRRLSEAFEHLDGDLFRREARIDDALTISDIDRPFLDAHELLQPFGAGNPQPMFLAPDVPLAPPRHFTPSSCELTLDDATGRAVAVLWPSANVLDPLFSNGTRSDVVFQIEPDAYAASGSRLTVLDARNSIDQ